MNSVSKCILKKRKKGEIELTMYINEKGKVPESFEEYLTIHKRVINSWDKKNRSLHQWKTSLQKQTACDSFSDRSSHLCRMEKDRDERNY